MALTLKVSASCVKSTADQTQDLAHDLRIVITVHFSYVSATEANITASCSGNVKSTLVPTDDLAQVLTVHFSSGSATEASIRASSGASVGTTSAVD